MLVLQSLHGLSLEATERMVRDRLSWMRFCGLGIADTVPDARLILYPQGGHVWVGRDAEMSAAIDAFLRETGYSH